jgi:hypothetical protein
MRHYEADGNNIINKIRYLQWWRHQPKRLPGVEVDGHSFLSTMALLKVSTIA